MLAQKTTNKGVAMSAKKNAKKSEVNFILYKSSNEVIVTTVRDQQKTIKLYFSEGGRDLDDYDVELVSDFAVEIRSTIHC